VSGFAPEWLALRETADARARHRGLVEALAARLGSRQHINVVDIGSGTGANLRALAPMLGKRQSWKLVDNDPRLIAAARSALQQWAETCSSSGGELVLGKDGREIRVAFLLQDLAQGIETALDGPLDLLTASALFDLASADYIGHFALAAADRRAAVYAVLTYNGIQRWSPRHPADNAFISAFHRHMMRDKGLGLAAGPMAPTHLAEQLALAGYLVQAGESPWRLGVRDARLIAELQKGTAAAVAETRAVDDRTLAAWTHMARSAVEIGHTDTLAFPE
jgi:SAM-dependent methyltransferase